jgi:heme a synthase
MNLERTPTTIVTYPLWMRGWCTLTLVAAVAGIAIGTLVTTFHVGMADKLWPTAPWHLLISERVPDFGYYIEHSHRIANYLVGLCMFVQAMALWRWCPQAGRRIVAWLSLIGLGVGLSVWMRMVRTSGERSVEALLNPGLLMLVGPAAILLFVVGLDVASATAGRWQRLIVSIASIGVIVQASLGGLRVYLNELHGPELAVIHGVFAQVVLACTALMVLMTVPRWNTLLDLEFDPVMRRLSALTVGLLLVQIVFGGLLRHMENPFGQRLHPMLAFAIAGLVVWMAALTFGQSAGSRMLRGKAVALLILVGLQAALGVEAFIRTADPLIRASSVELSSATIRSLHVLTGFGVFTSAVLLSARAWKSRLI